MIERILRIADLHDADALTEGTWEDSTPTERLAAVETIRRATIDLHGTPVQGLERILRVADAPSCEIRARRRARDRRAR
ncbi:MAG: hypothetical protein U0359_05690 [Byssovorax sp.]